VNHVAFSPDGHTLAITHRNGSVWLADLRVTGHHGETLGGARGPGRPSPVDAVAYSPDGQTVAGGSKDGTVRLWDARTHRLLGKPLPGHAGPVSAVSFSRDGRTVAVAEPRLVTLWDVRTRREVGEPLGAWKAKIRSVAFSPDGRTLAVAGAGVHLVDLDTHRELAVLGRRFGAANDVAFSPDGRTLASSTEDGTVRLWGVRRRVPVGQPLRFDPGNVRGLQTLAIAFSPDGRTLAGIREGEGETLLAHWDLATHVELAEVSFARFDPLDVAFSPDGTTLALPGSDGTVRLVDATPHTRLGNPLRGHVGGVNAVAFSADGRTLVTAGDDGTVRLWNGFLVPTGDLAYARRLVCSLVGGRLSRQDWAEFARGIAYPKHQTCP
jgi:WD40 repeat protein